MYEYRLKEGKRSETSARKSVLSLKLQAEEMLISFRNFMDGCN